MNCKNIFFLITRTSDIKQNLQQKKVYQKKSEVLNTANHSRNIFKYINSRQQMCIKKETKNFWKSSLFCDAHSCVENPAKHCIINMHIDNFAQPYEFYYRQHVQHEISSNSCSTAKKHKILNKTMENIVKLVVNPCCCCDVWYVCRFFTSFISSFH